MKTHCLWMTLALATVASAQRTWIVDLRGGAGVDFLDLAPAVAAASPGDTILLVYALSTPITQSYHGAVIDRPLRVIGVSEIGLPLDPGGVSVENRVEVRNIPAGTEVLLAYLNLKGRNDPNPPNLPIPHGLVIQNCAGRVHIESVNYHPQSLVGSGEIRFEDCTDVSLHWCDLKQPGPSILVRRSNVSISNAAIYPFYPSFLCYEPICTDRTAATFQVENSTLRLCDVHIWGANQSQSLYNGLQVDRPAVNLVSGTLLMGPAAYLYGGTSFGGPIYAVGTGGTVVTDPRSNHTGIWQSTVQNQRLDTVYMERVIRNQPFHVVVAGPPNGFMLLAMGLPMPQTVTLPFGDLLLDPNAMGVLGLGALDQLGFVQQQYSVPAIAPMNLLCAFQAATLSSNGVLGLTWPAVFSIAWEGGHTWP